MLFELLIAAQNGAAHNGILAPCFGLVLVPQVSGQQIEVGGVAELAFVVDDENKLGTEADDIDGLAVEQLVQFGQLETAAILGTDRLRLGAVRVEQIAP